jgi:CarboxypepD_reg-like domain
MSTRTLLSFAFILFGYVLLAQPIRIEGSITDTVTGKPLSGVSIQIGRQAGTVSNKEGQFSMVVSDALLQKHGLRCTYIGYLPAVASYLPGKTKYTIAMKPTADSLSEVVVSPKGLNLVKKAIAAIEDNYPRKPFVLKGLARTYNVINDTDYFYANTAILESYFQDVAKREAPRTRLVQTRDTLVKNPLAKESGQIDRLRWLGAFHISDFIYGQGGYFSTEKLDQYSFYYRKIEQLDGYAVHRIEFTSRQGVRKEGVLYLDTASLAFVGLDITVYSINRIGSLTMDVGIFESRYQQIGQKWYLRHENANAKYIFSNKSQYLIAYHMLELDTLPTRKQKVGLGESIQKEDENKLQQKKVSDSAWHKWEPSILALEAQDYLPVVETPYLSMTAGKNSTAQKADLKVGFGNRLLLYLLSDKVNWVVGLQSAGAAPMYPTMGKLSIADAVRIQYLMHWRFNIWKGLFAGIQAGSNFGIGGTRSTSVLWSAAYDFPFNKKKRPMTFSPVVGWHIQKLRHRTTKERWRHQGLVSGFQWRIEKSRKKAFWLQGLYHFNHTADNAGTNLSVAPVKFSLGIGLFIR